MTYEFTNEWFEAQRPIHQRYLTSIIDPDGPLRILEVGSHEGRSTVYFLEKLPNEQSTVVCIDPFECSDSTSPVTNETFIRFRSNVFKTGKVKQLLHIQERSHDGLPALVTGNNEFDYALIDGSHLNKDVMFDACLVFQLVRSGGIIFFDDYNWGLITDPHGPSLGIKNWLAAYENYLEVLHVGYHLVVKKK